MVLLNSVLEVKYILATEVLRSNAIGLLSVRLFEENKPRAK